MAKLEAEVANPFLPKESQPSKPPYYYIRIPIIDYEQPYLIIPLCPSDRRLRKCISCKCYCMNLILLIALLFIVVVGLILWHSQPKLNVVHVQLNHINISRSKDTIVLLDTSMDLEVKIQSQDFISHNYNLLSILIGYNGTWLRSTTTNASFVNARSISYLEATVKLNGTQVLESPFEQHDDISMGFVPLKIVIEVGAKLHLLSINVPFQGRTACLVNVDVANQSIGSQDCYPGHDLVVDLPVV